LVLRTAWRIDAEGFAAVRDDISLIKFHVAEVLQEVIDRSVQVHGALGLTDDTVLGIYYAHERGSRIYDGPDEVHKVAAAKRILKRYRPQAEDDTRDVRKGEELDGARLQAFLSAKLGALGPVTVKQFPGGHSNLTYLVRCAGKEYVLRRPPFGTKVKTAHDMGREFRVLSQLAPVYPRAPRPVLFCEDESVLGAKFYLMERIPGVILRRELPAGLEIKPAVAKRLCESFVDVLCELHALDVKAIGLGDFGQPEGYVARQVGGWAKRYKDAQTDDIPEVEQVGKWLGTHLPVSGPPTLIHNDYKFDNLVLDPGDLSKIVGILDWEMATLGDPLMDLGTALCYWVDATDPDLLQLFAFGPTALPGMLTRRQVAERYGAATGRDLSHIGFYYCFGLFKTAVVAQQIYARYKQGLTHDERFAMFIEAVRVLARQAAAAIDRPL
jgi:aminoglycoside phosphotransferase (APT) family kinase protein